MLRQARKKNYKRLVVRITSRGLDASIGVRRTSPVYSNMRLDPILETESRPDDASVLEMGPGDVGVEKTK